jgi:aminoglycoside phosphotransferase family enzyme
MNTNATRKDIDDVLGVLDVMMTRIDERFTKLESNDAKTQEQIKNIMNNLDSFVKRQEISDDERLVMGHQLERLDRWTHELADKIGYKLAT